MRNYNRNPTILELKDQLMLTIFGSYENKTAIAELVSLKDSLQADGYKKCKLVRDYAFPRKNPNENYDQYFNRKSIYWIQNSDACIFVFLDGVRNDGVAFELQYTCYNLEEKLETSLIAIDSKCSRYTTSLLRGKIATLLQDEKIIQFLFKNRGQLFNRCKKSSLSFLKIRQYYLLERIKKY